MLRRLILWRLSVVERPLGVSIEYVRHILRASLGAFFKFAEILPIVQRTLGDATSCQLVTITV